MTSTHTAAGYQHIALLYSGPEEFVQRTVPFIRAGVAAREPTLVVVPPEKIERLRAALGHDATRAAYAADGTAEFLARALPEVLASAERMRFSLATIAGARAFVASLAGGYRLTSEPALRSGADPKR